MPTKASSSSGSSPGSPALAVPVAFEQSPWQVEWLPPGDLTPHPEELKEHSPVQLASLAESLERHGWLRPIVWNRRTGHILNGRALREAALYLQWERVPVRVVDVPYYQERRILLLFDRIGRMREVDYTQLAALVQTVHAAEGELPLGVSHRDYQELLARAQDQQEALAAQDPQGPQVLPPGETDAHYAPNPYEARAGEDGTAPLRTERTHRPLTLSFGEGDHQEFSARIRVLCERWGTSGVGDTVLEALRRVGEVRL